MSQPQNKKPSIRDEELRMGGIVLIQNALKARFMIEPLINSFENKTETAADKNWSCYMIQQSIELALKGITRYYYTPFAEGHFVPLNVRLLLELTEKHSELNEITDSLLELQGPVVPTILAKWQALSRYKKIYATNENIMHTLDILDDILAFIRRHHMYEEIKYKH